MIAVMVFHYNPAWLPGGFIGVGVFLVISSFLITGILLNKKAKPDYSRSELRQRAGLQIQSPNNHSKQLRDDFRV